MKNEINGYVPEGESLEETLKAGFGVNIQNLKNQFQGCMWEVPPNEDMECGTVVRRRIVLEVRAEDGR